MLLIRLQNCQGLLLACPLPAGILISVLSLLSFQDCQLPLVSRGPGLHPHQASYLIPTCIAKMGAKAEVGSKALRLSLKWALPRTHTEFWVHCRECSGNLGCDHMALHTTLATE